MTLRSPTRPFPFDHLTQAELAERDKLREKRAKGPLDFEDAVRLANLDRRSLQPPPYDSTLDFPPSAA